MANAYNHEICHFFINIVKVVEFFWYQGPVVKECNEWNERKEMTGIEGM